MTAVVFYHNRISAKRAVMTPQLQPEETRTQKKATPNHAWIGLAAILMAAAVLRYIGIHWGLPGELHMFSYHPDEFHSLRGVFALMTGDPNPHFFNYGSLYLYLVAFSCLMLSGGQLSLTSFDQLPCMLPEWTMIGRDVTLVAALLTVLAVYALARAIAGHRQGLLAAALCAVFPLHVLHSHYATVDVTQALMTTVALLMAVRIYQAPRQRNYVLAGLAVGLAASVKYNGGLVLLAPLCAHLLLLRQTDRPSAPTRNLWWLLGMAAVAFLLTSPYTVLDWTHAKQDIAYELRHMREGEWPAKEADPNGYWFHAVNLTMTTCGGTFFALLGAWALLRDRQYRSHALILLVFGLLWVAIIGASGVRYGRYALPLVPVIAVLAAAAPLLIWRSRSEVKIAAILMMAALVSVNTYYSGSLSQQLMQPDDRDRALWVIADYVPETSDIGTVWEPWFQGPPLDYVNGGTMLRQNPLWQAFSRQIRAHRTLGLDPQALREAAPYAFIHSNFEVRDALRVGHHHVQEVMEVLSEQYRLVWHNPTRAPLAGMLGWAPPQDWLYPFPELALWVRQQPSVQSDENGTSLHEAN
jgi:hypothetical protein